LKSQETNAASYTTHVSSQLIKSYSLNLNVIGELRVDKFMVFVVPFHLSPPFSDELFVPVGKSVQFFFISRSFLLTGEDLAERRMMNRRFFTPYDDFIHSYYDEYQPSYHSSSNGAHNDIYGRMYSDHGELKTAN
jgi:hypothetical protein